MNIIIERPFATTEKGKRRNNEDYIYPSSELAGPDRRLFIVCDGVGGSEKGEIASELACDSFETYFNTFLEEGDNPSEAFIQKAVRYTESRFDEYVKHNPEAQGMATTFALLYIGNKGITVAYAGDSRIYQFRDGQIIFKTEDHRLVNSLVKLGKITEEEAERHPQKNVITKAIIGSEHITSADVQLITDLEPGDMFFLCTDGVTETFTDRELEKIFNKKNNSEEIKNTIVERCINQSNDNYSFYIIPIFDTKKNANYKQNILSFFYSFA
ncbi:MAG: protein phosphatase 2C domain-containing protein [Tannerella sp.]|jgi:protein phosphatase|nr:protein phosphatase 2C domain-containing protein [Tannerella sp.]